MVRTTCKYCGEKLPPYHKLFCDNDCKMNYSKYNRNHRPCRDCGERYKPKTKCSKVCDKCKKLIKQNGLNKRLKENR